VALVRCTEAYQPTHQQAIEAVLAEAAAVAAVVEAAAVVKGLWKEGHLGHQAHPVVAVVIVVKCFHSKERRRVKRQKPLDSKPHKRRQKPLDSKPHKRRQKPLDSKPHKRRHN
jgi:hypothetical protein